MKDDLRQEIEHWEKLSETGYGDDRKLMRKVIAALKEADAVAEACGWCGRNGVQINFFTPADAQAVRVSDGSTVRFGQTLPEAVAALRKRLEESHAHGTDDQR